MTNPNTALTPKERYGYGFAALAQGAMYAMMSSWIVRYQQDVLGLSPVFITMLMWGARIWDAINDPLMGTVVDRTRTKFGKMRPYLLIASIPAAILTVLIFYKPAFSQTGLMVYAAITYVAWGMIYTICDVPFWALPSAMTTNSEERTGFLSFARLLNSIGGALPILLVSVLSAQNMLGQQTGFLVSAILFAVLGGILLFRTFFITKERTEPSKEIPSLKENLLLIKQNKPLLIAMAVGILCFGRYMVQGIASYAADYVFTTDIVFINSNKMIFTTALIGVGMFPAMLLMPKLFKRFNHKQIVIGAGIMSFVVGVLFFVVGLATNYNMLAALPFLFLSGMPLGIFNIITYAIIADSVDYLEHKTGKRAEGLSFSTQTFMNKFGAAISAGLIPLILGFSFVGYQKPIDDVLQPQGDNSKLAIFIMLTLLPAVSILASVVPMLKYDFVGEKKAQILKELEERKMKNA